MKIVADENIPFAEEAFASLGDLRLLPAARLTSAEVRGADALIVRSVTQVNKSLLAGTRVCFVGTVTAGVDHIDTDFLAERGIAFASAGGCNATAVAQHVAAFLCALHEHWAHRDRRSIGIVGVGHCGSRVERIAQALGFDTVLCDPPLARATGSARFRPLAELKDCDVLTLHTPLIREGPDRTLSVIDEAYLRSMKPGCIVINTARGGLVEELSLAAMLATGQLAAAAIDAWQGEPLIDLAVLAAVTIATPHVAGYSHEGRARGTEMIHSALCKHLGIEAHWSSAPHAPKSNQTIQIVTDAPTHDAAIAAAVLAAHPIQRTDADLRRLSAQPTTQRAAYFENLRKNGMRHELSAFSVQAECIDPPLAHRLAALDFSLEGPPEF